MSNAEPEPPQESPEETPEERFERAQRLRLAERAKAKGLFKPLGYSQASFTPPPARRNSPKPPEDS